MPPVKWPVFCAIEKGGKEKRPMPESGFQLSPSCKDIFLFTLLAN